MSLEWFCPTFAAAARLSFASLNSYFWKYPICTVTDRWTDQWATAAKARQTDLIKIKIKVYKGKGETRREHVYLYSIKQNTWTSGLQSHTHTQMNYFWFPYHSLLSSRNSTTAICKIISIINTINSYRAGISVTMPHNFLRGSYFLIQNYFSHPKTFYAKINSAIITCRKLL